MKRKSWYVTVSLMAIAFLLCNIQVQGQKGDIKYSGNLHGDVLFGSFETSGSITTSHGITYKNWTTSLGTGLDFYRYRTIPLFLDIKRNFKLADLHPFIQVSSGLNIAHPTNSEKIRDNWWGIWWPTASDTLNFSNGYYSKIGVGLVLNPKSKVKVSAIGGWSYKTITERYEEYVYNGVTGSMETHTNKYRLNRWSFGLGVSL